MDKTRTLPTRNIPGSNITKLMVTPYQTYEPATVTIAM